MEQGYKIADYRLPVNTPKKNFKGVEKRTVYSLQDLKMGDTSGTTETDAKTNAPDPGYTLINQKY